jgi:hypothetical protein
MVTINLHTVGPVQLLFRLRAVIRASVQKSILIDHRRRFHRHARDRSMGLLGLRQRSGAFVWVVLDARALVYATRHHASPGEESVVNGVGRNVHIAVPEVDVDHDKVVDVIELVADLICSNLACNTSYDKVPRGAAGDFVGHMWWHVKLSVAPTKLKLTWLAFQTAC